MASGHMPTQADFTDPAELPAVVTHFLNWDSCTTLCGLKDYDVPEYDELDTDDPGAVTCPACRAALITRARGTEPR